MAGRRDLEADFHTHSTASDGALAPAELAQEAASRGLSVLALTDHDTVAGLGEAGTAASEQGLAFVRGVELSTHVERGEVHILGYGVDPESEQLRAELGRFREARRTRAARILERLHELGFELDAGRLDSISDEESIGRPHIARLLIDAGHVSSVQDAFDRYLGRGRPAYVPREALEPPDAVRLVIDAGGLPVMAHPFTDPDFGDHLPELIAAGLQGLEVYYGEYGERQRAILASIAEQHGLIATGGSDYHGPDFREGRDLGSVRIPQEVIRSLLAALGVQIPPKAVC